MPRSQPAVWELCMCDTLNRSVEYIKPDAGVGLDRRWRGGTSAVAGSEVYSQVWVCRLCLPVGVRCPRNAYCCSCRPLVSWRQRVSHSRDKRRTLLCFRSASHQVSLAMFHMAP